MGTAPKPKIRFTNNKQPASSNIKQAMSQIVKPAVFAIIPPDSCWIIPENMVDGCGTKSQMSDDSRLSVISSIDGAHYQQIRYSQSSE